VFASCSVNMRYMVSFFVLYLLVNKCLDQVEKVKQRQGKA
jgi:hypothetical protein